VDSRAAWWLLLTRFSLERCSGSQNRPGSSVRFRSLRFLTSHPSTEPVSCRFPIGHASVRRSGRWVTRRDPTFLFGSTLSVRRYEFMSKRLYVGNLPFTATEEEIRNIFEAEGRKVENVSVISDRETGRPRGFAFVEMTTQQDAESAVQKLNGYQMGGRTLT